MFNSIVRGMKMRRYLVGMVMLVLAAAGYSQRSDAALIGACPTTGTFATLFALGACTIDDKTFSDFQYSATQAGGAVLVPAGSVNYAVVNSGGVDGFAFTFPLIAGANQTNDINMFYTVTCTVTVDCIISAELSMTGSGIGGGSAGIDDTFCIGESDFETSCAGHTSFTLTTFNNGTIIRNSASADCQTQPLLCPGVTILGVDKDIITTGGAAGSANISAAANTVDQQHAPEPATLFLLGAGLVSLAAFRRRKAS